MTNTKYTAIIHGVYLNKMPDQHIVEESPLFDTKEEAFKFAAFEADPKDVFAIVSIDNLTGRVTTIMTRFELLTEIENREEQEREDERIGGQNFVSDCRYFQ